METTFQFHAHILIASLVVIAVMLATYAQIVQLLHSNDESWLKPKHIVVLEHISVGLFGLSILIVIIIVTIYTILNL
jgi:hypothetical protein